MNGLVKPRTYGRMGNFLFQAAAAMGYAWRHGMDYTLPSTTNHPRHNPIYLQHLVRKDWNPRLLTVTIKECSHDYQVLPFVPDWRERNIVLDGYWQTEKYFLEFRDDVIAAFGFPWRKQKGVVSVHVRRTDYLTLTDKHPPVPKQWMERAMMSFPGAHFLFFSDDYAWCRSEFGNRTDCGFCEGKDEVEDLIAMSCCEHHICSASTFSWWGAWLNRNPDKRVVMPLHWFGPKYRKTTETRDIVPESWERLP